MRYCMIVEQEKTYDVDTELLSKALAKVEAAQRTKNTSLNSFEARNCYVWPSGINILEN